MTSRVDVGRRLAQLIDPDAPPHADLESLRPLARNLVQAARQHRVAGLLARALDQRGLFEQLAEARDELRRAVIDERTMHLRNAELGRRANDALAREGIPALLLKGAALGPLVYADPALRPMTDIDLLVPAELRKRALEVLVLAGFVRPSQELEAFWSKAYYNLPLKHHEFPAMMLELHWSIAQAGRHAPDLEGLFRRSQSLPDGARALCTEDLLLHQTLHHSYHYFEPKLIWIYDLALLHRLPHDPAAVIARAKTWKMTVPLALSICHLQRVFPDSTSSIYREFAARIGRCRWLLNRFPATDALELFGGWDHRRRQLIIGLVMLERPAQMATQLWGWAWRAWRFGDRAGRTIGKELPR